jgi:phosphatidate phosphatase APP1
MIVNELIGKKVVLHVSAGSTVALHRGVLEGVDNLFVKLKKDNETIFFVLSNVVGIQGV